MQKKSLILDILKKCNGAYMCKIAHLTLYHSVFLEFIFLYHKHMFGNEFTCQDKKINLRKNPHHNWMVNKI